ncbi:MAG: sensor histidine kinase [Saprospiraceae bacterium]|nr:sensor histidine kinase [Saprospiraceae bacterium]
MEATREIDVFIFLAIGMLTLFLLAGGVVVFFVTYQKRMLTQQLRLSEMERAHQEELLHSNIEQVEAERHRIATDLHDEVGSIFSTLKLKINQLQRGENPGKILEDSSEIIDAGLMSVRRISHELVPPSLEMFGLADALAALCQKASTSQLQLELNCEDDFQRLPVKTELGLYRIVQELINNAIRHSGASRINLYLSRQADHITLVFEDNGKGADPSVLNAAKGLGIKNIEARASQFNASVNWVSQPGQGLKTIILIPQEPNVT